MPGVNIVTATADEYVLDIQSEAAGAWDITLANDAIAVTIIDGPPSVQSDLYVLLRQDTTGGRVATWPDTVTFASSAPQPTADQPVFIHLISLDGIHWYESPMEDDQSGSSGQTAIIYALFNAGIAAGGFSGIPTPQISAPFDPSSNANNPGQFSNVITTPQLDYAAGPLATISTGIAASALMTAPSTADRYDFQFTVNISDAASANSIEVSGFASIALGDTTASLASTDFTASFTGVDLSYDPATGEISSAAGGTYGIALVMRGSWD